MNCDVTHAGVYNYIWASITENQPKTGPKKLRHYPDDRRHHRLFIYGSLPGKHDLENNCFLDIYLLHKYTGRI